MIDEIPLALASISTSLESHPSVIKVVLHGNAVGEHITELEPFLSKSSSIRYLDISNQGLSQGNGPVAGNALLKAASSSKSGTSELRVLVCGRHQLKKSAAIFGTVAGLNPNLISFDMSGQTGIRGSEFQAISEGLQKCLHLRHLGLEDQTGMSEETDEEPDSNGWPAFIEGLRLWEDLRYLNLNGCNMDDEALEGILRVFKGGKHAKLHTLLLESNDFEDEHYELLRDVVKDDLPALKVISLDGNSVFEDNDVLDDLQEILEGRGGELNRDDIREWTTPTEDVDESEKPVVEVRNEATPYAKSLPVEEEDDLAAQLQELNIK